MPVLEFKLHFNNNDNHSNKKQQQFQFHTAGKCTFYGFEASFTCEGTIFPKCDSLCSKLCHLIVLM